MTHKYIPRFFRQKTEFYLGRYLRGLCTRIWKSAYSTRLSGNKDFGLPSHPTTTFSPRWAELPVRCGNDAPWDLWRTFYRRVLVRPTELGNPHQTRGFHIPTATTATASDVAVRPDPLKSRALPDSCAEPLRERVINRDYKLSSSKTWKAYIDKGQLCTQVRRSARQQTHRDKLSNASESSRM
jgi:hypothetical protein